MSQYLTNLIHSFGPVALFTGLIYVLANGLQAQTRVIRTNLLYSVMIGLPAGALLAVMVAPKVSLTALTTGLRSTVIVLLVLQMLSLILHSKAWLGSQLRLLAWGMVLILAAVLAAQAVFDFFQYTAEQSLSVTQVLHTELILNIGAIAVGAFVIGFLTFMSARMVAATPRLLWSLYLLVAFLLLLKWSGDAMLGMLQLDMMELTSGRLSFVGKVTNFSWVLSYLTLLLTLLLCVMFYRGRTRTEISTDSNLQGPERRKLMAKALLEQRWLRSGVLSVLFLASSMLYYDLYASRPPSLSEASVIQPDSQGVVRIALSEVTDGHLHRYAYISKDGHRVRFFLINVLASRDRTRMSAVYDACMICGDAGYIQDGNEVICIACNVRIFVPSIGKPGGCNPIPFEWEQDETHVLIKQAVLEKGAMYFSEIVEIEVQDPVTGKILINLKAPHQYDFRGKTFYFENRESFEQFKADPLKHAGDTEKRHFRAEGWKS